MCLLKPIPRALGAPRRPRPRLARPLAGQGVVEFALVSLLLFTLSVGVLDLGRAVLARSLLTNATREAARAASVAPGDTAAIAKAARDRSPGLGLAASAVTVSCSTWGSASPVAAPQARSCDPASTSQIPVRRGDQVQVCVAHTLGLAAPRVVGLSTIAMAECARSIVQ